MPQATFDLKQAELLLPRLEEWLRAAVEQKQRVQELGKEQTCWLEHIVMAGGCHVDVAEFARLRQQKEAAADRLRDLVEGIEGQGCLVKDLDMGLIDFPCRVADQEFYLCWKLGESHIQFWHYMDEGFSGRKPIDEKLIRQLRSCSH